MRVEGGSYTPAVLGLEGSNLVPWLGVLGGIAALLAYLTGRSDARRSMASRVFVVVTVAGLGRPDGVVTATIHNGSGAPLFEVWLTLHEYGKRRRGWRVRSANKAWTGAPVLGGGRLFTTITAVEAESAELPAPTTQWPSHNPTPQVVLTFRDANGRRWTRWPDGKLTERLRD
jgi:hypothetical protein